MVITEDEWEILNKNSHLNRDQMELLLNKKLTFEEMKTFLFSLKDDKEVWNKFNTALWYIPTSMNNDEWEKLYKIFLKENWHHEHSNMAKIFQLQFNNNFKNIEPLLYLINNLPEFYKYDDDLKYPFIRKCIYAIGAQPEPYNIEALEGLAKSEDEQIRELALHQIEKRKEKGRWEAKSKST